MEGYLRLRVGGLIFGRAYFFFGGGGGGLLSEFYGMSYKLLPDKFSEKSLSLVAFASILKTLLTYKVSTGTFCPPPPPPTRPNRVTD